MINTEKAYNLIKKNIFCIKKTNKVNIKKSIGLYLAEDIKSNINTDRKVILGEVKHLDAIAIIEDNVNPVIKKIYPDQNGRYASLELRKFEVLIDDNLSGFEPNEKSFAMILNGEPQIYSFQPKTKKIKYELDRPLKIGEHQLEIEIKDRAENITKKNIQFIVY